MGRDLRGVFDGARTVRGPPHDDPRARDLDLVRSRARPSTALARHGATFCVTNTDAGGLGTAYELTMVDFTVPIR
jgi:hypothetical protein